MAQVKVVSFQEESTLTGEKIRVFLKNRKNNGVSLDVWVNGTDPGYIMGYDVERFDIKIAVEDIDYIHICPTGGTDIEKFYREQRGK